MDNSNLLKLLGVPDYLRGDCDDPYVPLGVLAVSPRTTKTTKQPPVPQRRVKPEAALGSTKDRSPRTDRPPIRRPPTPSAAKASKPTQPPEVKIPLTPEGKFRPPLSPTSRGLADHQASGDFKEKWETISQAIRTCEQCPLHSSRTHAVVGQGHLSPRLFIIGEAPGAEEDFSGLAFVGRSGWLLTSLIDAMGFRRQDIFIGNMIKCRPPNNRKPSPEELQTCYPHLLQQLELLQPEAILALGATAAHFLLKTDVPIGKLRGETYHLEVGDRKIPMFVSFHPSYLLRQGSQKRLAWQDCKRIIRFFTQSSA